jgi:tetratricopeptide (TPR) repeat protein
LAWAAGNAAGAKRAFLHYLALRPDPSDYRVFQIYANLCAELGFVSELKKSIEQAVRDKWPPKFQVAVAKGALALADGHNAKALPQLRDTLDALEGLRLSPFTNMAKDLLATGLERQGDFAGAVQVLRAAELNDVEGPDLDARYHLAKLYRKAGNSSEGQKIEMDLLKRLKYADADHPILVQLQRQSQLAASVSNPPN